MSDEAEDTMYHIVIGPAQGMDKEHAELLSKELIADGFHDHVVNVRPLRGHDDEGPIFEDPFPVGATIIDCGDKGEIVDAREHDEEGHVYDIEWEDADSVTYPHSEIELGIVDGTIGVYA